VYRSPENGGFQNSLFIWFYSSLPQQLNHFYRLGSLLFSVILMVGFALIVNG
jgi:predicted tellurium resistance membrane protein TerC